MFLNGWAEMSNWLARYGGAWRDVFSSLLELVVIVLSPILALTAPLWALAQHIFLKRLQRNNRN